MRNCGRPVATLIALNGRLLLLIIYLAGAVGRFPVGFRQARRVGNKRACPVRIAGEMPVHVVAGRVPQGGDCLKHKAALSGGAATDAGKPRGRSGGA